MEDVMIRISVLWIFSAVASSAHYAMIFAEPSLIQKMLSEETTPSKEMTLSTKGAIMEALVSWLIPLSMAFLSVTLGDLIHILNMVLGGLYALWGIIHLAVCPIIHISKKPAIHQVLICISQIVVTALILLYAWNW